MNYLNIFLLIIAIAAMILSVVVVISTRNRTRDILERMHKMISDAIDGEFIEEFFDESLLSSVEARLADYLSSSKVSVKNLTFEKDKIKELISDISHQTKTPIANILLYAQLLKEQDIPKESKEYILALNNQAEKLSFLISSLVKMSRLESGIFAFNPVKNKIQPMLDTIEEQIRPKAVLKDIGFAIKPADDRAYFDEKWMTEAIYNIVDNAVKYTNEGGQIQIDVRSYPLFCRIDIADTGIGITEEEREKVFQRFYRSSSVFDVEGIGIGLYLTRQIVSAQGGYMKVQSKVGEGSLFSIFLPREAQNLS